MQVVVASRDMRYGPTIRYSRTLSIRLLATFLSSRPFGLLLLHTYCKSGFLESGKIIIAVTCNRHSSTQTSQTSTIPSPFLLYSFLTNLGFSDLLQFSADTLHTKPCSTLSSPHFPMRSRVCTPILDMTGRRCGPQFGMSDWAGDTANTDQLLDPPRYLGNFQGLCEVD